MAISIRQKLDALLKEKEFVYVATTDANRFPNAIPIFLLKMEGNFLYLIDFIFGKTYENLKQDPKVSVAVMDEYTLHGYKISGSVEMIEEGRIFDQLIEELREREMRFTVDRIVSAVQTGKTHQNFELQFPAHAVILKIKLDSVVEVNLQGKLRKENL